MKLSESQRVALQLLAAHADEMPADPVVWTIYEGTGRALEKRGLVKASFRRFYTEVGFSITQEGRAELGKVGVK